MPAKKKQKPPVATLTIEAHFDRVISDEEIRDMLSVITGYGWVKSAELEVPMPQKRDVSHLRT